MNAYFRFDGVELWHVAGWTMLHFVWLGAVLMLAALVCRMLLRQASAGVRYAAATVSLALLAALPIGIAMWLVGQPAAVPVVEQLGGAAQQMSQVQQAPQGIFGGPSPRVATTEPVVELAGGDERSVTPGATGSASVLAAIDANTGTASGTLAMGAVLESVVPYLPWLWLAGTPITFALLATGLVGTKRLRVASRAIDDGPIADACTRLVRAMRIRGRVAVAVCERIAAPVLVGIVRPIILLPPAALVGWSPDEVEMVLLHELAHVRRWDNLVNLLQRIVESLLFFHPAVWWASAWMRREREVCCDAVVVGHTHEPRAYAEMLVAMAAALSRGRGRPGSLVTVSAMAAGPLRSRICRILQLEDDPMLVSGKSLVLAMGGFVLTATLAVLYVPSLGQAEQSTTEVTENTEDDAESAESEREVERSRQIQMQTAGGEQVTAESQDGRLRVQIRKRKTSDKFPSLEQQKLADFAWRMLGLELEPIGPEDIGRVKAFGYDGGVKVTGYQFGRYGVGGKDGIWSGDILVGLHVWPTTSLEAVADVLNRGDLAELNPLKYYAVRRREPGPYGGENPFDFETTTGAVITGRILVGPLPTVSGPVSADSQSPKVGEPFEIMLPVSPSGKEEVTAPGAPVQMMQESGNVDKSSLRYDGKTFNQWREEWRNELSPERRTEAVNALATFGANGYGKEAAEAILEIVRQYDWQFIGNSPVGMLQEQAKQAFTGVDGAIHIPATDWLPPLVDGIRSGNKRIAAFANWVLPSLTEADLAPRLIELSRDDGLKSVRLPIFTALGVIHSTRPEAQIDKQITERLTEALESDDPDLVRIALQELYRLDKYGVHGARYRPELLQVLAHGSPDNRLTVVHILGAIGPQAEPAVPQLLPVVLDPFPDRSSAAVVAITNITRSREVITTYLNKVIDEAKDPEQVERAERVLSQLTSSWPGLRSPVAPGAAVNRRGHE